MRYLTEDLEGTGGRIKVHPADFRVTEIPLYEPSGTGDHVYLYVEKEGIGSLEAAERIARAFGRPRHLVGLAGLKDAQAVTRQWMSLERVDPDKAAALHLPAIKVLAVSRHRHRLKIGHLAGNRFEVRLRGCRPHARKLTAAVLEVLQRRGVPNWFDRQRFGTRGDNHLLGRALVLGQAKEFCDRFLGRPSETADSPRLAGARRAYDAGNLEEAKKGFTGHADQLRVLMTLARTRDLERAMRALPKQLARLLVGAYQSDLFNAVLDRRLDEIDRVETGDLAYIHPRVPRPARGGPCSPPSGPAGAVFRVERPEDEAPRAARFEISPTGPIVGHRVTLASARPGEIERAMLAEKGVSPADFERVKALRLRGDRRPLRVPLIDVEVDPVGNDIVVRFTLPSGAYATVVLGEITKS
jgi:tRNA pseudouridine13 synthase